VGSKLDTSRDSTCEQLRTSGLFVKTGDVMRIEFEGCGTLTTRCGLTRASAEADARTSFRRAAMAGERRQTPCLPESGPPCSPDGSPINGHHLG
jgi:hypothetical protein